MALLNIGASNRDDAFYRYKMPRLITKIEGRGNGIKTNLVNMVDVAKALARPPAYTTKYFGCELGAQSKFDLKTATAIVNGAHDTAKLAGLLENFIKKYVQCYECRNPETEIVITKSQLIILKCAACGFLSDVDMRDKLTTFILKNPPEQKKKKGEKKGLRRAENERLKEGDAVDEEMKRVKKETKKKKAQETAHVSKKKASDSEEDELSPTASQADDAEEVAAEEEEVQWQTDTSLKAAQERIKEQLTTATSEMVMLNSNSDEPEVITHVAIDKVKEVKTVSKTPPKKMGPVSEVKEADLMSLNKLSIHDKLVENFKGCLRGGFNANQLVDRLHEVMVQSSDQEVMNAFFESLFDGIHKDLSKEIGKKKLYLSKAITDEHSQELLLGAMEAYYICGPREAYNEVALVLKKFYDLDILEEEVILAWYDNDSVGADVSKVKQVKMAAKPFVVWLQNAESEDED